MACRRPGRGARSNDCRPARAGGGYDSRLTKRHLHVESRIGTGFDLDTLLDRSLRSLVPDPHVIRAWWKRVDLEGSVGTRDSEVWVVEHRHPRLRPRMLIAIDGDEPRCL